MLCVALLHDTTLAWQSVSFNNLNTKMTGCFMTGGMAGSRGNISRAGLHRKLAQGKWVGGNLGTLLTSLQSNIDKPSSPREIFSSDQRCNSALEMRDQEREGFSQI